MSSTRYVVEDACSNNNKDPDDDEEASSSSLCASSEVEMNYLDVLPNEILLQIFLEHLSPFWQIVCKSVCLRWYHLLQPATRQVLLSHKYLGVHNYWFAKEALVEAT